MSGNVGAFICSVRFSIVCALGTVCGDWVWSTRAEHFLLATFWEQNMTCCCIRSASASLRSRARSASERSTLSRQVVLGLPRSGVRSGSSPPSLSRQVGLGPPSLALLASQVGFGPLTLALASGRPLPPPLAFVPGLRLAPFALVSGRAQPLLRALARSASNSLPGFRVRSASDLSGWRPTAPAPLT